MCRISVIITVLNREHDISRVLSSLLAQSYSEFEVILVDNGSTDRTLNIVSAFEEDDRLKVLDASHVKGSPYSSRNMGIKQSTGELIAFIDGYASPTWLEHLHDHLERTKSDIVSGKVIIEVDSNSSLYELYDHVFSLDTQFMVNKYKAAPTANLLVKKAVFDNIGMFDEKVRSGGDFEFTGRATKSGFSIVYAEKATSYYFSRNKKQILSKQKRVALGQVNIWQKNKTVNYEIFKTLIKIILPMKYSETKRRIENNSSLELKEIDIVKMHFLRMKLDKLRLLHTLGYSLGIYNDI